VLTGVAASGGDERGMRRTAWTARLPTLDAMAFDAGLVRGLTREHEAHDGSEGEEARTEAEPEHRRTNVGVGHGCPSNVEESEEGWGGHGDEEQTDEAEWPRFGVDDDGDDAAEHEGDCAESGNGGEPAVDQSSVEEVDEGNRAPTSHDPGGRAGEEHRTGSEDDAACSDGGSLPPMEAVWFGQFPARAWTARSMASSPAVIAERPASSRTA